MSTALDQWPIVGRHEDLELFERALADRACAGFLVHGPAGVGKTRLADECRAIAERLGFTIAVAVASRTAANLPLGALAHLLPPDVEGATFDPVRLFDRVRDDLASRLDGARLVLSIDDVHLLDVASATLVSQLLASGLAFLIGTIRDGETVPDAVTALWRNGTVVRVDLGDLGQDDVATTLHLALGGPVAAGVTDRMWKVSEGNALFLHELVLEALDSGALHEVDGVWRCDVLPTGSRRLIELVGDRIAGLDDVARGVLDLLALCQPIGLIDLDAVAPATVLEDLERSGLIEVQSEARRHWVMLAHPLYGEALRSALPTLRRRRILLEQAARIEAHGARRRADPLRIATWRLDADGQADPELLVRGAMVARFANDFRGTERLARAATRTDPTPEALLLLGEALYELGSFDEAEQVLTEADQPGLPEDLVLQITVMRCKNLHWGHCDPDAAMEVNLAARDRVSAEGLGELRADEASIRVFNGDPLGALAVIADLGDLTDPRDRVLRAISEAPALSCTGRTSEAIEVAERGFAEHLALTEPLAIAHAGTHVIAQVFALTDAGRLAEAEALVTMVHEITSADRVPIAVIWSMLNLGRVTLLQGRVATALRWYREGTLLARDHHFAAPLRLGLSGAAMSHALLGDARAARAAFAEQQLLPAFGFLRAEQLLGRAWVAQVEGDPAGARALLLQGADDALATGHRVGASWLLHEAVRLGEPGLADRLGAIAAESDSALVRVRAEHAAALDSGDAVALEAALEACLELGLVLVAAETAIAAAEAQRRAGDQRAAAALYRRADDLASSCEGARTPGLTRSDAIVPLSRREREVALLAAAGTASKDIAERLFLSVRTVDNHLQRAYTKLGVTGRAELADALGRAGLEAS